MADEVVDLDSLSDDDFMAAIEAGSEPIEEDTDSTDDTHFEDTDQQEDTDELASEEPETNDLDDGQDDDTGFEDTGSDEEAGEENAQLNENGSEEEGEVANADDSKDNAETEDGNESSEADEVDYKEQYAALMEKASELQRFKDEVTSEFIANGKRVRGFDDPKKIIQSQQMAAGYAEKMAEHKKYRPFLNTLKEKGFLENPDKFNLAMQLIDGDPEAIKKQIKDLEIDPFEMDMENINYAPKNQVASNIELAFDDLLDNAQQYNVDDQVRNVISKDWDDQSVVALLEDPESSSDLVKHISSGAYDVVQQRIAEKKRIDVNGVYTAQPAINQYREAAAELELEYLQYLEQNQGMQGNEQNIQNQTPPNIQANNVNPNVEQEYKSKVQKKNDDAAEARKRAASVSKKKKVVRTVKKDKMNPDNMSDDELTAYLDSIMYTT
jgi:hypothetical protein